MLRTANLPCWRNFPLARRIEKHYRLPTRLINDANAAAFAEARWGAGKGQASVFYVSLGTGIGTALILEGRIHEGRTGGAGEGGHVTINFRGPLCGCGKRGCVELYASGTAIAKCARNLLAGAGGKRSRMRKMAAREISGVTTEIVSKAAAGGDRLAKKIMDEAAEYLAIWLGGMIDVLEPEVIIFGGGLGAVMLAYARPNSAKTGNVGDQSAMEKGPDRGRAVRTGIRAGRRGSTVVCAARKLAS